MAVKDYFNLKAVLFDNRSTKQTIFKNTFWIGLSTAISKALKLVLVIYVARVLGAVEYGKFSFALAFVSLFVVLFDLGLPNIVTREFSREKEKEKEFLSVVSLKLLLSLGTLCLIFIGSFFITADLQIRMTIWILAVFSAVGNFAEIIYSFFRARQRMEYESWAVILEALIVVSIGFFVILNLPSIINLSYSYLFSVLVSLSFILVIFHFKVFPLDISWQKSTWQKFLAMSWPLALSALFTTTYGYIDSVMMGHWGQIVETGWYNAASRIVNTATIPMGFIATSFYPVLSKFFKESPLLLKKVWILQMKLMMIMALLLVTAGLVFAPQIINLVYGPDFAPSILAFRILIVMAGLIFLASPFTQILMATDQQKKIFRVTFWGAVTNIVLNLILIPRFSLYGAAVASVATYLVTLILMATFTFRHTPITLSLFKLWRPNPK